MTGQQWLTGQVVPDFSGFANIFDHMWSARVFLTGRGSRITEKDFQTCKCFQLFMYVFFDAGIMLHLRGYVRLTAYM